MKPEAYAGLAEARGEFKKLVARWSKKAPYLAAFQERLKFELGCDDYTLETPIVYNEALDDIGAEDEIAFVLAADNPGKNEQKAANRRYLVGQSGKLAEGFFRRELGVDFRKNVLIINKTPIHTPKTTQLKRLLAIAGAEASDDASSDGATNGDREALEALLAESQVAMARIAYKLHALLGAPLWISGLGELGPRGLFRHYAEALRIEYATAPEELREGVLLFSHFSMNRFAIEYREKADPQASAMENLRRIGADNRRRVLGW